MADIFNRNTDAYGGSFAADGAYVSFTTEVALPDDAGLVGNADKNVGLLTQNLTINYQQQIQRIYEIGTAFHFFVAGRTQGTMQVGRIMGPRPISIAFYAKFGDVCNCSTNNIDLTLATGCSTVGQFIDTTSFLLSARFCVINSIAISMNAQDMLISEQLQMMYCALDITSFADFFNSPAAAPGPAVAAPAGQPAAGGPAVNPAPAHPGVLGIPAVGLVGAGLA